MSTQQKVESAKNALRTAAQLIKFCAETNAFMRHTRKSLFEKILARDDLSQEQKENEIEIATAGILIVALSSHQTRYRYEQKKNDYLSPYLWDANSYLKSPYYPKQQKEVLAISGVNELPEPVNEMADEHIETYNERLVLAVGTKVMNGELPFQPEILNKIFDKHTQDTLAMYDRERQSLLDTLEPAKVEKIKQALSNNITALKEYVRLTALKINQTPRRYYISAILSETVNRTSHTIEAAFNEALNTAVMGNETPEKMKFREGLVALKQATLARFQRGSASFVFDDGETIANNALMLATKVSSNTVTEADVKQFIKATQKYKTDHTLAIALAVIVGAVIGMVVGAAVGLAVSSVPGAILGGVAGFGLGAGLAGVSSSMWYIQKEPLNKVSSAAIEVRSSQNAKSI